MKCLTLLLLSIVATTMAYGTLIGPPKLLIVGSLDGSALLRIDPGDYWRERGTSTQSAKAIAFLYDRDSKSYRAAYTFKLVNSVAPGSAVISDGANFIFTCDDWLGTTGKKNAFALYRGNGELVKAWALEDIFSKTEMYTLLPAVDGIPHPLRDTNAFFVSSPAGPSIWINTGRDFPLHVNLELDVATLSFRKYPQPH